MRKGDRREILIDGDKLLCEFIGQGRHCQAFRRGDTVYCLCRDDEYMKEVLVHCHDSPHLPPTEEHRHLSRGTFPRVYSMPYYPTVTPRNAETWTQMNLLKKTAEDLFHEKYVGKLHFEGNYFNHDIIERTHDKVPESVTEALEELTRVGENYGAGVAMEFRKANIGVNPDGGIVFRDCLFDAEKLYREMRKRIASRHSW